MVRLISRNRTRDLVSGVGSVKTAIMGSGGLGGFFGGWLASSGADVTFIARGEHLSAIRKNGLKITSQLGDRHITNVAATDDPNEIDPVDIILFCVKNYDLMEAAEVCRPMLKPETAIISLMNGVEASTRIGSILGDQHAVTGLTFVPSNISAPGVIAHLGTKTDIVFGETDGGSSPRLEAFHKVCIQAGLEAEISSDIVTAAWKKFVPWSAMSSASTAARVDFGGLQSRPELVRLFADLASETLRIGQKSGAKLDEDYIDQLTALIKTYPPSTRNSMFVDLSLGKRIELDAASGTVIRLGRELDIETPIHRALYAVLLPYIDGRIDLGH